MRKTLSLFIVLSLFGCSSPKHHYSTKEINKEITSGNFTRATGLIDSLISGRPLSEEQQCTLLFTQDSLRRVRLDFNKTRDEVVDWIEKNRLFTPSDSLLDKNTRIQDYRRRETIFPECRPQYIPSRCFGERADKDPRTRIRYTA